MAKIDITRTELVWPGKYDGEGNLVPPRRVTLPFQVIERVNETRATREERKEEREGHVATLFDYWRADKEQKGATDDSWRNKLIWGDNVYVMGSLLEHFGGQFDLIYIDPPFATGADFSFTTSVGDHDIVKEQSVLEEKAYRDTWGQGLDSYLHMMHERLALMRELLSPSGSIYVHIDWHIGHYLKIVLDEIFGRSEFVNEIIRVKSNPKNFEQPQFGNIHDTILFYAVSRDSKTWHPPRQPLTEEQILNDFPKTEPETGRLYKTDPLHAPGVRHGITGEPWRGVSPPHGRHWAYTPDKLEDFEEQGLIEWSETGNPRRKTYADESPGYPYQDIWTEFKDPFYKIYPTEKDPGLLDLIVRASSNEGDLVADFFCGSGTTLAVAEKLDRRWIGCDLSRYAIHVTRKRLMDISDVYPFEILNLGKYERQVWQGMAFGGDKRTQRMLIFEYLKFILELYGAQPLPGTKHLHGKKGSAVVHIGAVDAPVTIDEINACLVECKAMDQGELHMLGWEWEMGLANLMVEEARAQGIKLLLLKIPREVMERQAVDKGDIQFYELAYLEAETEVDDRVVTVELTDFVIPSDELIPSEVREKISKWSDYVDYWAVDWDFQNDTFVNGWTSYRTRQDRRLELTTDPHGYEHARTYRIMVKVIDVFGNDTSQIFEIEVT